MIRLALARRRPRLPGVIAERAEETASAAVDAGEAPDAEAAVGTALRVLDRQDPEHGGAEEER